jgi:hypothetical protein
MTVIVSDSFNRVDSATLGTADTGQTWTTNGTRGISSNQAYVNADYGGVGIDTGITEFSVQVTFSNIVSEPSLVFRRVDGTVAVGVVALSSSYVIKGFNFNEGWMTYQTYSTTPVNGDIIKVEVKTNIAKVYLNSVLILTWTISSQYSSTATNVGLRSLSSSNKFDDFIVDNLIIASTKGFKVWNSTSFVDVPLSSIKYFDGTQFSQVKAVKQWDGSNWVDVIVNNPFATIPYWVDWLNNDSASTQNPLGQTFG